MWRGGSVGVLFVRVPSGHVSYKMCTSAKPLYDSIASSGGDVSQSDRLADTIINLDSKTGRHNKFNRAFYNAVSAQATTSVILGDKGDGSPRARADALARYAHYSADHVPDIIEQQAAKNGNAVLYESKCWTQLKMSNNLGGGTRAGGGSPSTAMGHLVAFGGTEETLLYQNIGCKARGDPSLGAFDHATGAGWVREHRGAYHNAMVDKANHVTMLIACDMGGIAGGTVATLHRLSKNAAEGRDGTVYGVHSNANYFTHHATAISFATVTAAAEAIERGVNKRARELTRHPHTVAGS